MYCTIPVVVKINLLKQRLARYLLAGGLSYAVELCVLLVLYILFGLSAEFATALAFWVGLTTSFLLQKTFAFQDYKKTVKAITGQIGAYAALVGFNYLFTIGLVALFPSKWVIFSRTLALIITTTWNYVIYKKFIFHPTALSKLRKQTLTHFNLNKRNIAFFVALTLPIIVFFYQYVATGNKAYDGDFDYYAQLYEAFRISVLDFHQLPLWNPWLSGGIPLASNPQFGLVSLQSVFVLLFGAITGLKLAYAAYGVIGFWGMYVLGRKSLDATPLRSALIAYIWVFCGFFAGHGVWHLTFTSFYFLPWLIYFVDQRHKKYSWLGFGIVESLVILSSVHYAVLMMTFAIAIYFVIALTRLALSKDRFRINFTLNKLDALFILKGGLTVLLLAGYELYQTYYFVSANERITASLTELPNSVGLLLQAMFVPFGTIIKSYPVTTWGWGEYSMYVGVGTFLALVVCLASLIYALVTKKRGKLISGLSLLVPLLLVGLIAALLALGDHGPHSPFHLLHNLPGFTQTRTPTRWLLFTTFALLVLLLAWKPHRKVINILLAISVLELFMTNGPFRAPPTQQFTPPPAKFSSTFSQYDNGFMHKDASTNHMHSYYYTTTRNIGQIYADDSLINTLSSTPLLKTNRCGLNVNPSCTFVLTDNAKVTYWSPNKITLERTGSGPIELNMNVERGWRVNGVYPYANTTSLQPSYRFVLPKDASHYELEYAPKFSPSWVSWRLQNL